MFCVCVGCPLASPPVPNILNVDGLPRTPVAASGTGPLSYQWFKGAAPISGATQAVLMLGAVSASDEGSYSVTVTNALGSVTSNAASKPATVPAGQHAKQVLEAAGLWSVLQPRIVPADSVRQVLDYLARGEVDAGLVYRTDAAAMPQRVRVVQEYQTSRL